MDLDGRRTPSPVATLSSCGVCLLEPSPPIANGLKPPRGMSHFSPTIRAWTGAVSLPAPAAGGCFSNHAGIRRCRDHNEYDWPAGDGRVRAVALKQFGTKIERNDNSEVISVSAKRIGDARLVRIKRLSELKWPG